VSGLAAHVIATHGGFQLDVDVEAAPGEVLGILGPNGAGKTTLLRVLSGLTPLSEGRVELSGRVLDDPTADVFVPPERRPVGVVFQDYLLFPHLSVLENVAFSARARSVPKQKARRRATEWLDRLGVAELAGRRPTEPSGGQAQRVALARALAGDPGLVLLDEPLAALGAGTRLTVRTDLRRHLVGFGGPALLVTHDPIEAMVLADRLLVMDGGRAVQRGTPAEVEPDARAPTTWPGWSGSTSTAAPPVTAPSSWTAGACCTRPTSMPADRCSWPCGRRRWRCTRAGRRAARATCGGGPGRRPGAARDRVRGQVAGLPSVLADVTPAAVAELGLVADRAVWISAKARELEVYPTA